MAKKTNEPKYISNPKKVQDGQWHYEMTCEFCGSEFHAKRRTAKFCSDTCRVMHYYGGMKEITKQKQTTIFASSRGELKDFFKKMGHNIGDHQISRTKPEEIEIKGVKWIVKRLSHMTYAIEQE